MEQPLGIDTQRPLLSWQLQDAAFGAKQTAYRIQVATAPPLLTQGKANVWDSGRVVSDRSVNVAYTGPALVAAKRYYWRVQVWDKDGRPYPESAVSWWETGLMDAQNWRAKWVGFEQEEERRIRESGAAWITNSGAENYHGNGITKHDFRYGFNLSKPVKRAVLYVTGRDTAAAWVNGKQVVQPMAMPAWKQFPWQTYTTQDVTSSLHAGRNLLAVEVTLYAANPDGMAAPTDSRTPMSACLYIEMEDGSVDLFKSGEGWKGGLNVEGSWQSADYDDTKWQAAVAYVPPASANGNAAPGPPWPTESVKLLRKTFDVSSPITSARLYVTALGAYQMHINGRRVGDQVLAPGWMDFREHVPYQAYDVTALLKTGANVLGAYLAPGWYTTPLMWFRQGYNYGSTPPALKAQMRLEHADGSVQWVATDESWKADSSPVLKAEIYDGETYDARRTQPGWDTASFPGDSWKPVALIEPVEPAIVAQYFPPVRVEKILKAKAVTSPSPSVYIYDFAQNLAGVASLRAQGPAGTDVRLRFAEVLNPDGTIYTENLRTAKATDHFILSGKGVESYQPTFTFHGFRYVEVSGLPAKPAADAVEAVVFHSDAPFTAQLHTGSAMINQLWENILWGQRSNFISVPTDCPQRDERLGWTADAQVFWRTASYNMDLTQFSKKFAADVRGTQVGTTKYGIFAPGTITPNPGYAAGWSDAGVIIPWTAWLQSGDTRVIEENWEAMEKYLDAIQADNPDFLWSKNYGTPYGDWLSPEGPTRETLVATAYWAYDVTLMRQMAHALGKADAEAKYGDLFHNIQAAFVKEFVSQDGFVKSADKGPSPFGQINNPNAKAKGDDTQAGYVLALQMNLLPDSLRGPAADKLVGKIAANGWKLGTGFLGTPYLLAVLVDTGHADVAYRLLLNTEYPSWGYLVGHGATTMWERWNGDQMRNDPSMNSYNHYAYGAVADWIYRYAAGIDALPIDSGFHTVFLHPNFDARLGSLDFSYQSLYGEIKSSWSIQGKHVQWKVTIPPNTTAQLPLSADQASSFTLDGIGLDRSKKVKLLKTEGNTQTYEFAAGSYSLEVVRP
ncbi:Alfa-L-rhamnosidase [Acidisarcina polymorpha]|uniref:alpha-L-rhamnosidase n=2 Tax=Acidisarcina polymorpha TaxID=2211140 RepID=A0A2Z5FVF8_9BACT|nr:Alfa-L-rhamnosidase [Acidisarcina polymorpha]